MFEQMNEQFKTAMKPMSDLASLNLSTMQSLAEKQSELYSSIMSESMSYFELLSSRKDIMGVAETQKAYATSIQEKMTDTAKSSYSIISESQEKAGEMVKGMSDSMTSSFANATKK